MKRAAINIFLLFHLIAITCWCLPLTTPLLTAIRNEIRPYFFWAGLFQSWDMFAPDPMRINNYVEAQIMYADRSRGTWAFPRMEHLDYTERYYRERYRKFLENLPAESNAALWPDVARHVARLNNRPGNPPAAVILIRYVSDIPPPDAAGHYQPGPWRGNAFFVYVVKPEDLK